MLTHPTLDQLRALKLDGMVDAFIELQQQDMAKDLSHAEWLALLLDREIAKRNTKRVQIRLRAARLRHGQACVEDVDYRTARQLDKALFQQLATCRWIAEHHNLFLIGPTGIGKSWLACALAHKACRDGYTVHYTRAPRLFVELVSSITQFDGLACAANEGRRVDFALPRCARGSRRARAGQGQGLRLALSRHPVTAAARDGARVERPGRGNGSAGTEPENVGKEVRRAPRLAQASFPLPFPARCRECGKRNWEFSAASG
jgi:IstB-like ATP binding protein